MNILITEQLRVTLENFGIDLIEQMTRTDGGVVYIDRHWDKKQGCDLLEIICGIRPDPMKAGSRRHDGDLAWEFCLRWRPDDGALTVYRGHGPVIRSTLGPSPSDPHEPQRRPAIRRSRA